MTYDPERWLETTYECLEGYVNANIDTSLYEIQMEFPSQLDMPTKFVPLDKTIIHFELDENLVEPVGLSDKPMVENFNSTDSTVNPQWAAKHMLNFDVGIWATASTGGPSARMKVIQHLQRLFGFQSSITALREFSDGGDGAVEIVKFTGGKSAEDSVNDIRLFRTIGGELVVRVFSRTPLSAESSPAIEEIDQSPGLTIIG